MPLEALIAEDEELLRQSLVEQLGRLWPELKLVAECEDGASALEQLAETRPDIAFLDIRMPGISGIEVARSLSELSPRTQVVFVTAYDQYAIDAFEVNAVDYLLKPVEPERLERAIERVRGRLANERAAGGGAMGGEELRRIVQYVTDRQARQAQLAVKVGERFQLIQSSDIIYAALADDAITVVTHDLSGTSSFRTLDELQANLDPAVFWRVRRSHLININKVKEIVPWFSRNYILKMQDASGTEIPVSRAQTKRLRTHLNL